MLKQEISRNQDSTSNKLWSSLMANAPSSTWQHEHLEGVIDYGTTVRRQPTKTEFKSIKKLLFTSRKFTDELETYTAFQTTDVVRQLSNRLSGRHPCNRRIYSSD